MPRERTMKQQAVYHVLLRYGRAVGRTAVCPGPAVSALGNLPESLVAALPQSEGHARDILEALVRRGDAKRWPGSPARYSGIVVAALQGQEDPR